VSAPFDQELLLLHRDGTALLGHVQRFHALAIAFFELGSRLGTQGAGGFATALQVLDEAIGDRASAIGGNDDQCGVDDDGG